MYKDFSFGVFSEYCSRTKKQNQKKLAGRKQQYSILSPRAIKLVDQSDWEKKREQKNEALLYEPTIMAP